MTQESDLEYAVNSKEKIHKETSQTINGLMKEVCGSQKTKPK